MKELNINPFTKLDKEFALVTAGTKERFNSMTISWGMMGTIYNEKAVTIYIRESRYTMEFLKDEDYFTITFLNDENKKAFGIMGSKSGRDANKVEESGLTPLFLDKGITYEEKKEVLVCRKIYMDELKKENLSNDFHKFYETPNEKEPHYIIIGVVEDII